MIVKDEGKFIGKALKGVKGFVDEIIVVDTGSKDKTSEIAKKSGAKVFKFKWNNDFSKARNFSLKKSTKDWILILDADEIISEYDLKRIRKITELNEVDAVSMIQKNYSNDRKSLGWIPVKEKNIYTKDFTGFFPSEIIRLFRNKGKIKYRGGVHETVDESLMKIKAKIARSNIAIHHYQELKGKNTFREKQIEYLEILKKDIKRNPKNARTYHDMGIIHYKFKKDYKNAIKYLSKAVKLNPNNVNALIDLGSAYIEVKDYDNALKYYEMALKKDPNNPSIFNNLGVVYILKKNFQAAIDHYKQAILLNHPRKNELLREIERLERLMNEGKEDIKYSFSIG